MAIAFRDSVVTTSGAGGGATTQAVTKPTTTANGDLLLCFMGNRSGTAGSMTPPDGTWTLQFGAGSRERRAHVLEQDRGGVRAEHLHWFTDVATKWAVVTIAYSGVDPTTPIHQKNSSVDTVGGLGPFSTPGITTTITTWLVCAFMSRLTRTAQTWSAENFDPGNLTATERGDTNTTGTNGTSCAAADSNGTLAAGTWTGQATPNETTGNTGAMILALNPAAAAVTAPSRPLIVRQAVNRASRY